VRLLNGRLSRRRREDARQVTLFKGQSLPGSACSRQLALPGQQEHLGSNLAQRLMVLGAQVVGAVLVAELVDGARLP
jgi:hypothetical protein